MPPRAHPVYLEVGRRRVFACSLAWPGWCRSGADEEAALATLAAYGSRYAPVAARAGLAFSPTPRLEVVDRVPGSATTDFGAPGAVPGADRSAPSAATARRTAALVRAAWDVFDQVGAGAPAVLRKGPRGGGRDRDAMIEHVVEAERTYARKIGVRHPPAHGDPAKVADLRAEVAEVLAGAHRAPAPPEAGWPLPYAARRIAWHALDHAWEMEDRSC